MSAPALASFDYSALPADVAAEAVEVARRIKGRTRRIGQEIIEIGRDLILIKDRVGHGNFLPWLEAEFGWSERTAQNYIQSAQAFGEKSATVADLPPTIIYNLSAPSTPAPVREKIVERLEAGERLAPEIITTMVKEGREAAKEERRQSKLTPQEKRKEDRSKASRERRAEEEKIRRAEFDAHRAREREADSRVIQSIIAHFGSDISELLRDLEAGSYLCQGIASELRKRLRDEDVEIAA